jgi:hypothetical protein
LDGLKIYDSIKLVMRRVAVREVHVVGDRGQDLCFATYRVVEARSVDENDLMSIELELVRGNICSILKGQGRHENRISSSHLQDDRSWPMPTSLPLAFRIIELFPLPVIPMTAIRIDGFEAEDMILLSECVEHE